MAVKTATHSGLLGGVSQISSSQVAGRGDLATSSGINSIWGIHAPYCRPTKAGLFGVRLMLQDR